MYVVKRNGAHERVHMDKITSRIAKLCTGLSEDHCDPVVVTQKVVAGLHSGVTTAELDELAAEICFAMTTQHPEYGILAARLVVSNMHKQLPQSFSETMRQLYEHMEPVTGAHAPLVSKEFLDVVERHAERLDAAIDRERDYGYSYFGMRTLERSYLKAIGGKVVEIPQHMLMRVAVGLHGDDLDAVLRTYELESLRYYTHASPTLFNAGTPRPQMSSCFLMKMKGDSIKGIFSTLSDCADVSHHAGGIGLSANKIRAAGTYIAGTTGHSNGLVPMLRVFNNTARYVDQGGNKRPGAFAIYVEPWHADIFDFLDLKKNTGKEEARARDLFYGLWIPDLFMRRVEANDQWSLFCPHQCPGLDDTWGEEFEALYARYEKEGRARRTVSAQRLWYAILEAQTETGTPYMLYKDACNRKSNQQNLGTICCSNLCTEIIQYSSPDEIAVCNLASLALPRFVREDGTFDYAKLHEVAQAVLLNLNRVIDCNFYPLPETRLSNLRHRPVGLGVQGLADVFQLMRLPFESPGAADVNRLIFETIYHACLTASCAEARRHGPYETYPGSPVSRGILQPDMWGATPSDLWDWKSLRRDVARYGVRNSLMIAPMPTASTSQILGHNEAIEPYTSNVYSRRVLAGEFQVVNPHLVKDLVRLGLWTPAIRNKIVADGGSVQRLAELPLEIKELYKTVWEISQRRIIDLAADRAPYIDQSQSLNLHVAQPNFGKLTSMHFYAWKKGLKTGMYYLRTRPAADAIQFTVDKSPELAAGLAPKSCDLTTDGRCTSCEG